MDVTKLHNLGWKHKIDLAEGIKIAYEDFLEKAENVAAR
jgi:GDP-L-fucose synthase